MAYNFSGVQVCNDAEIAKFILRFQPQVSNVCHPNFIATLWYGGFY